MLVVRPGNTDLAWTRLTPWRALLAAALDQHPLRYRASASVRRADQPQRRPARRLARRPAQGEGDPPPVRRPRHHRGGAGHQGGPDPDRRLDGELATFSSPASPTGRSPSSGATCPSCSPRSCAGSTRTTSTPPLGRQGEAAEGDRPARPPRSPRRRIEVHDPDAADAGAAVAGERLPERRTPRPGRGPRSAHRRHHRRRRCTAARRARARTSSVDWSRVVVWWGDERFVAADSDDRNALQARGVPRPAVWRGPRCTRCRRRRTPTTADAARRRTPPRCASTAPASSRC